MRPPSAGGGAPGTTPPDATAEGQGGMPPPSPPAPPASQPIAPERLQQLLAIEQQHNASQAEVRRLADEAQQRAAAEAKTQAEFKASYDSLQKQRDQEAEQRRQVERNWLDTTRDAQLAAALAGFDFVGPEAAQQVRTLVAQRFDAKLVDGKPVVADATGRAPADVVKELLAGPAYAHFLKPKGGGSGAAEAPPSGGQGQGQGKAPDFNELGYSYMRKLELGGGFRIPR